MEFNVGKCLVPNYRFKKERSEYVVNAEISGNVEKQRYLGVHVQKLITYRGNAKNNVRRRLQCYPLSQCGWHTKVIKVMIELYKFLVRLTLEDRIQIWAPEWTKNKLG